MNTTRRFYIDRFMNNFSHQIKGGILDLGGVRGKRRGNYFYNLNQEKNRVVINNNPKANPDYLLSIEEDFNLYKKFDTVIVNEVIEYIDNLDNLFKNILKVSNRKTKLIMTWPWMNTFHGDKAYDLKRYSKVYIENILLKHNFKIEFIENNGGIFSVVWDFFHTLNSKNKNVFLRKFCKLLLLLCYQLFIKLDNLLNTSEIVTTGFTMVARLEK
tara:strand:- start:4728 stop:5369 length:642 start_codon:yes stop_codon:yes gene_type:complete